MHRNKEVVEITPEQRKEHVGMKIPTVARSKIIWWRLTKDDIEATIAQEFSKTTFSYGTTVTQNTSKPR